MRSLIQSWRSPFLVAAARFRDACSHKTARRGLISVADQIIVSGTNFLTTICLGRACLPEELGLYSIGFSLTVAIMGIPKALIWTPYTTLVPKLPDGERPAYTGSALAHQMFLSIFVAGIVSASAAGMWIAGATQNLAGMLAILGPVTALILLREFVRRACFSCLLVEQAFLLDVLASALQIGGMLLLAALGALNASRAFMVIAVACLPVIGLWLFLNRSILLLRRARIAADWVVNWTYARWLFIGALVFALNDTLYFWVLSWLHGPASVGMLAAANGAIFLTNPLILGAINFIGPHAAHIYAKSGMRELNRHVMTVWAVMTAGMLLFLIAMILWGDELVGLLFGAKYAGQEQIIVALALGQFADVSGTPFTLGLLAMGRGDSLLRTYVIRLALTLTVGMYCVHQFGAPGVGYGQAFSNLGATVTQWWIFRSIALAAEGEE